MPSNDDGSKKMLWTGRILMTLAVLFLLMDSIMKLFKPEFVVKATVQLGFPESTIVGIGVTLLVCTVLYIIPQTSVLGAILLTGYLVGAVAINARAGTGLFNTMVPIVFAIVVWAALVLQHRRLRSVLLPSSERSPSTGSTSANLIPNY